jgi:hypothetical protein
MIPQPSITTARNRFLNLRPDCRQGQAEDKHWWRPDCVWLIGTRKLLFADRHWQIATVFADRHWQIATDGYFPDAP